MKKWEEARRQKQYTDKINKAKPTISNKILIELIRVLTDKTDIIRVNKHWIDYLIGKF